MTLTDDRIPDPPCKQCISMAICRITGSRTNGLSTLATRCNIINEYLTNDKGEWEFERMYKAFVYFDRGYNEIPL